MYTFSFLPAQHKLLEAFIVVDVDLIMFISVLLSLKSHKNAQICQNNFQICHSLVYHELDFQ